MFLSFKLNKWQSQVPSANLRYFFVKNKFGCSKPQFFPWSFINSSKMTIIFIDKQA